MLLLLRWQRTRGNELQDGRPGGLPAPQNAECVHIMFVGNLVAEAACNIYIYKRRPANKLESTNLI